MSQAYTAPAPIKIAAKIGDPVLPSSLATAKAIAEINRCNRMRWLRSVQRKKAKTVSKKQPTVNMPNRAVIAQNKLGLKTGQHSLCRGGHWSAHDIGVLALIFGCQIRFNRGQARF